MTAGPVVQLSLFDTADTTGPRVWRHHAEVPQDEPGLRVRDAQGINARNASPGRWWWTTRDGGELDPRYWAPTAPWYWPGYIHFPVTEVLAAVAA